MNSVSEAGGKGCGPSGTAFLLAQLGAHAARLFAERVATIGLTPPDAGLLRHVASSPGVSQRELAEHLGVVPSRMVALVDALEDRGLLRREPDATDRRAHALRLTPRGRDGLVKLAKLAADHESALCAALTDRERQQLATLCRRIADHQGLTPGVHPGYRQLGPTRSPDDGGQCR